MGISTECWRAAIGRFRQPNSWRCVYVPGQYDPGGKMDPLSDFCLRIVVCTIFLELLVAEKALLESACHTYVDWMEDLYGFEISEHVNVDPSNLSLPMCLQVMLHNNGGHLDLLQCGDIESNPGPELTKEDLAGLATAKDLHAVNVTLEKLLKVDMPILACIFFTYN